MKFDKSKYYYDEKTGDGFVKLFERLITHPKGPLSGKPFLLEEWEKDIIRQLFGVKHLDTGKRRYKDVFMFVPKKNGKTPFMAGILLIMTKLLKDNGSRVVSLASSRDQAKLVYKDMCEMIRNNSQLSEWFKIYQNAIVCGRKSYTPLSADVGTNDGDGCEVVLIDEVHRFKGRELIDLMGSSQASKSEPIFLMITTAGSDMNSICYEKYDYACKVRDGIIKDDTFLPIIYEADKNDDPYSEKTWKKANPNYGISVTKEFMEKAAKLAKSNASYRNSFLRLHLNIWTSVKDVWITDEEYMKDQPDLDISKLKGEPCIASLDLSSVSDLTSFTLLFPPSKRNYYPDKHLSFKYFWLPEEKGKDSADKNNQNYAKWLEDGFIEETIGNVIDYDYIEYRILEILQDFTLLKFYYDPYNSTQIVAKLGEVLGHDFMIKHRQGFVSMNEPTKTLEVLIKKGDFYHGNNPVSRWCMSNSVLLHDTGGQLVKIGKNTYSQKIDGTITDIMAISGTIGVQEQTGSWTDGLTEEQIIEILKG